MTDAPKSAVELVMERLRKKDAEAGADQRPLTDEQRAAIAEARRLHEAGIAERRIMHAAAIARTFDPGDRERLDEELRRDLQRFESDHEERIRKIRNGNKTGD
jgi:hypothetical protein